MTWDSFFLKKKKMLGNTWLEKGGLILVVMIFPTLCGGNEKQKCPFQDVISLMKLAY